MMSELRNSLDKPGHIARSFGSNENQMMCPLPRGSSCIQTEPRSDFSDSSPQLQPVRSALDLSSLLNLTTAPPSFLALKKLSPSTGTAIVSVSYPLARRERFSSWARKIVPGIDRVPLFDSKVATPDGFSPRRTSTPPSLTQSRTLVLLVRPLPEGHTSEV